MADPELVALVGCGRSKAETVGPVPAGSLYTGGLFKKSLLFARQRCQRVYIVSAEYGLLELDDPVETYDTALGDLCRGERHAWAIRAVRKLRDKMGDRPDRNGPPAFQVVILAGAEYADLLHEELQWNRIPSCRPLNGLPLGRRLQRLSRHTGPAKK